jgi:hypothetical protein
MTTTKEFDVSTFSVPSEDQLFVPKSKIKQSRKNDGHNILAGDIEYQSQQQNGMQTQKRLTPRSTCLCGCIFLLGMLLGIGISKISVSQWNRHSPAEQAEAPSGDPPMSKETEATPNVEMTNPPGFAFENAEDIPLVDDLGTNPVKNSEQTATRTQSPTHQPVDNNDSHDGEEEEESDSHILTNSTIAKYVDKCNREVPHMVEGSYNAEWLKADCGLGYKLPSPATPKSAASTKPTQQAHWRVHFNGLFWRSQNLMLTGCPLKKCPLTPTCVISYDTEQNGIYFSPDKADVQVVSAFTWMHYKGKNEQTEHNKYRVVYWREAYWPRPTTGEQIRMSFEMGVHYWSGVVVSSVVFCTTTYKLTWKTEPKESAIYFETNGFIYWRVHE